MIKMAANNITKITSPQKLLKNLLNSNSWKDDFKFATFLALMNASYKLVLCLLRRKIKNDKINSVIAAVLSAQWIVLEPKKRRQFMTALLLSRALDTQKTLILNHGIISEVPYFNVMIWSLCAIMQQYAFSYEMDCLNPGVKKFLRNWAALTVNDFRFQDTCNTHT